MNLGKLIKKERRAAKISQQDMAREIGLDKNHYCAVENGRRGVTVAVLEKVAVKLKKQLVITFIDKA